MSRSPETLCSFSLFDVQLPPGGIESFLDAGDTLWSSIDRCAGERGLKAVQVFTLTRGLAAPVETRTRGNTRFLFLRRRTFPPLFALLREVRRAAVVLFNNESWSDVFVMLAAKVAGARTITFYHNDVDLRKSKVPAPLMRFVRLRLLDSGMTNSIALKLKLKPHLPVPLFLFRFGVPPELLAPVSRQRIPGRIRLLTLGRVSREKRIEDIVEGIALARHRDQLQLTIAGPVNDRDPGYRSELERLATERGVACMFAGFVHPALLRETLAGADLFINMRPDEGFGKVFIEAMATGLPPAGRRLSPGPESLIRHNENGFLVTDSRDLAALLDSIVEGPERLDPVGRAAAQFVAAEYTTDVSIASFRRALDVHCAGKAAEDAFISGTSLPHLRRIMRLLLNQRTDFCDHTMVGGVSVNAEEAILRSLCIGRGIDVGNGSAATRPDASDEPLEMIADGELDYVVARRTIDNVQDPARTMNRWKRAIRIGGIIGIVAADHTFPNTAIPASAHRNSFTPESFRRLVLLVGGLSIERLENVMEDSSFACIMRRTG